MSPSKWIALIAFLPAAALAQGAASLDAAKAAGKAQQAGVERREQLIEAQEGAPVPAEAPAAPAEGVNLGKAAERLEGQAVEEAPPAGAPGRLAVPAPDTYTVRPGDTLWDLSGRYLNNPWYWPKVWSYNPEIPNPHWIYPGNLIRFYPSAEEAPTRVEPVPQVAEEAPTGPRELEDLSRGNIGKAEQLGEEDAVAVVGPYKVGQVKGRAVPVRRDNFITRHQLEESGVIDAAFEEKAMLSTHDKVYGRFTDPASVKVGQTYSVYRTEGPVRHPETGEVVGYKTLILGSARVVALNQPNQKVATLIVGQSYDVMERGNYLGPWSDRVVKPVAVRPNQASLDGVIVGVNPSIVTGVAEYSVVYLDKGKADGVEEGNTFSVVRSGDPYGEAPDRPKNDPSLPREVIGSLVVFDVKENASTAYVRRSRVELLVGDHVEMRPGASRTGAGG